MSKLTKKLDAGESAFFVEQLNHIMSELFKVEYPALMARSFLPVDTSAGPGAETITYEQFDRVGMAKLVSDYASDIPRVDVFGQRFTSPVESIASAFGFSVQEIRAAAMAGRPLSDMKANSAREADEQLLDSIAAFGDANTGLTGFLNNANVPSATVANPGAGTTWAVKTPDEIVADLQTIVSLIRTNTNQVESPDTIILPGSSFDLIAQTRMTGDATETILSYFLKTNPYITSIAQWYRLETAGAGSVKRMVCYKRDKSKLQLQIPQDYEVFEPERKGLEFVINTHMRVGGVTIQKPLSIRYGDGI